MLPRHFWAEFWRKHKTRTKEVEVKKADYANSSWSRGNLFLNFQRGILLCPLPRFPLNYSKEHPKMLQCWEEELSMPRKRWGGRWRKATHRVISPGLSAVLIYEWFPPNACKWEDRAPTSENFRVLNPSHSMLLAFWPWPNGVSRRTRPISDYSWWHRLEAGKAVSASVAGVKNVVGDDAEGDKVHFSEERKAELESVWGQEDKENSPWKFAHSAPRRWSDSARLSFTLIQINSDLQEHQLFGEIGDFANTFLLIFLID